MNIGRQIYAGLRYTFIGAVSQQVNLLRVLRQCIYSAIIIRINRFKNSRDGHKAATSQFTYRYTCMFYSFFILFLNIILFKSFAEKAWKVRKKYGNSEHSRKI